MTSDTSGRMLQQPFARYDPDTCCWKTSPVTSLWDLTLSSLTLPRWGSMRRGELFELPTPALRTDEPGSSSLPTPRATRGGSATETVYLLPTPEAKPSDSGPDYARAARDGSGGDDLTTTVHRTLLGTPRANLHKGATPSQITAGAPKSRLEDQVTLLPTPRATDGTKGGRTPQGAEREVERGRNLDLGMVHTLLPTPTSQAAKHSYDDRGPGTLDDCNLWSVATRIGGPTNPPLEGGSASPDAPPLGQLSLDEPDSA